LGKKEICEISKRKEQKIEYTKIEIKIENNYN